MKNFAEIVESGIDEIIFHWRTLLRSLRGADPVKGDDAENVKKLVELLLRQMSSWLSASAYDFEATAQAAAEYGQIRERQHAAVSDLVRELRLLKQCVADHLSSGARELSAEETLEIGRRADLLMDEVVATACERFVESLFRNERSDECTSMTPDGLSRFHRELELELQRSQRHSRKFALIIVTIEIAEEPLQAGQLEADQVLLELMRMIRARLRASDRIFRYDRYDFVLLCPETSLKNVSQFVSRLSLAIDSYRRKNRLEFDVISGVAAYPEDATDCSSLIQVALADQSFRAGILNC